VGFDYQYRSRVVDTHGSQIPKAPDQAPAPPMGLRSGMVPGLGTTVVIRLDAPPSLRHAHEELTQGSRRRWMTDSNCE
jgi:hypothetical protein